MKAQSVEWHEECLKNRKLYALRKRNESAQPGETAVAWIGAEGTVVKCP